jgi:hypothetical protein
MLDKDADRLALAARLNEALPRNGKLSDVELAKYCGISKAGVGSWRDTGRIAKKHLTRLAELSGQPLEWWLTGDPSQAAEGPPGLQSAEPDPRPYQGSYTVKLAAPAVTLDLSADCLVVWQQLQQLPIRDREEWRAKLDFAVASARMNKLGLTTEARPQDPKPESDRDLPIKIPPKARHTA